MLFRSNYEAMNNDLTICLGKASEIRFIGHHQEQDYQVTLADTGQDTMTGGRLARVRRYLSNETFMLTYGDGLADVDIKKLVAFHKSHGKIATVTTFRPASRFGILDISAQNQVSNFIEKPKSDAWASAGYFVLEPTVFDYLGGPDCILEKEPLERLAADGQLMAYHHEGFFQAMDTYREYEALNDLWKSGEAPWAVQE